MRLLLLPPTNHIEKNNKITDICSLQSTNYEK